MPMRYRKLGQWGIKVSEISLGAWVTYGDALSDLEQIKRITTDTVEFEDGEKIDLKNLDYRLIKPLIWW